MTDPQLAEAMVLSAARIAEHDVTAQRAELEAIVRLAEVYDLGDALHRLPTLDRPTGDLEQDRYLELLLDGHEDDLLRVLVQVEDLVDAINLGGDW